MNYLIDTHLLLWTILSPGKISQKVKSILINSDLVKFVSVVSFWEISLKFSLKKIYLEGIQPDYLPNMAKDSHFEILNLTPEIASSYHKLPHGEHKDPFDRMLAWQAIREGCILLTSDKEFSNYKQHGLRVVW